MSPSRTLLCLLTCVAGLALLVPASSLADEEKAPTTTTTAAASEATPPVETTSSAPAPEVAPTPAPSTGSTTESAPALVTPSAPASTTTTPQVSAQSAQGETPAGTGASTGGRAKSKVGSTPQQATESTGGSTGAPKRGKRAPKPSALTPPLPLSLSSSIAGVPAFFIESFRIPPFLLPIYQAAGTAYGVPWQVLAAINEVETDYGRDLSVSSAGAEGWMQFLPSSWATYGVDANGDGFKDPYNPADAIFAAARYLRAAGAATSVRGAIFSYNHSQAYVESVMLRAKLLGGTPSGLLGAIEGLTESRFPVHAKAHFSDGFPTLAPSGSTAAKPIPGTTIYAESGAPVIAVQDGQIVQIGETPELGHFISLRDAYGNTYTYAKLGSVAQLYPVLKPHDANATDPGSASADKTPEPRPTAPATAGTQAATAATPEEGTAPAEAAATSALSLGTPSGLGASVAEATPEPSSANTTSASPAPTLAASGAQATAPAGEAATTSTTAATPAPATTPAPASAEAAAPVTSQTAPTATTPRVFRSGPDDVYLHELHTGVRVIAGTVLGHVGESGAADGEAAEPHMLFQIRPAGVDSPQIDPKPILDGWVQLENSSVFRAKGQSPFQTSAPTAGQVLLESKEQLEQQVLKNPDIQIYPCGRQDIQTGQIDRRVLATLEFLAVSELKPTVSALKCGHSELTTEGNVSEHSTGDAVDISEINGIPIVGHQGPGSITDTTIRKLLTLQGTMKPHQIISLMSYPGTDNTLAKADHYNHIHVGFRPEGAEAASAGGSLSSAITPTEWIKLIDRLGEIPDPSVSSGPSTAAIPVHPGASGESEK
jgi:murein DD-endopeptidase MepM/ murein hydrolase activator NlpD